MGQLARIVKLKRGCSNTENISEGDVVRAERMSSCSEERVYAVWPVLTQDKWGLSCAILCESELEEIE